MHAYGPWLAVETDVTKGGARGRCFELGTVRVRVSVDVTEGGARRRCFELGTVGRLDDAVGEVHWGRVRSGDGAVREIVGEAEQLLDVPVGTGRGA